MDSSKALILYILLDLTLYSPSDLAVLVSDIAQVQWSDMIQSNKLALYRPSDLTLYNTDDQSF